MKEADVQNKPVIVDSHGFPYFYSDLRKHHVFLTCPCLLATQAVMVKKPDKDMWIGIKCPKCGKWLRVFAHGYVDTVAFDMVASEIIEKYLKEESK